MTRWFGRKHGLISTSSIHLWAFITLTNFFAIVFVDSIGVLRLMAMEVANEDVYGCLGLKGTKIRFTTKSRLRMFEKKKID